MMMIIITIIITTTTTTNSIQFYSILFHSTHVYYSAESRAGWPITNIAHHKSINNKGKKKTQHTRYIHIQNKRKVSQWWEV